MKKATHADKEKVTNILSAAFSDNRSVTYIIPQDSINKDRLRHLIKYSFNLCLRFGEVLLSDDQKGCALIIYPEKKRTSLTSLLWDLEFVIKCTGLSNIRKIIRREKIIERLHPLAPKCYIWFIGVLPGEQSKGVGSRLLREIIEYGRTSGRVMCLETSTPKNLPWYIKHGFTVYNELDLGYHLFFLKRG